MLVFVVKNDWVASLSHKNLHPSVGICISLLCESWGIRNISGEVMHIWSWVTQEHHLSLKRTTVKLQLRSWAGFWWMFFSFPRVLTWFNRDTRAVIKSSFFLSSSFYLPSKNILRILIYQPGFVEYHKSFGSTTHVGARCKEGMAPVGGKLSYFFQPTPCAGESLCSLWCGWAVSMYM